MERRQFLSLIGTGVAGLALRAIPLGRVWSFPKQIVIAKGDLDFLRTQRFRQDEIAAMFRVPAYAISSGYWRATPSSRKIDLAVASTLAMFRSLA